MLNMDIETKSAEMKFMRHSLMCHRRSEESLEELQADPVEKKLPQYKRKWLNHLIKMEDMPRTTS